MAIVQANKSQESERHVCTKIGIIPGIYLIARAEDAKKGGFRFLNDAVPIRMMACEDCGLIQLTSLNILRRNAQAQAREQAKVNDL